IGEFFSGAAKGQHATSPVHYPHFLPLAGLSLAGGAAAGYGLTDQLLKMLRTRARQARLDRARREYLQALTPPPAPGDKAADDRCELAQHFDRILEVMDRRGVKVAEHPDLSRFTGLLMGAYLLAAGGSLAYGGYKGYQNQRRGSKTRAIERANRERLN